MYYYTRVHYTNSLIPITKKKRPIAFATTYSRHLRYFLIGTTDQDLDHLALLDLVKRSFGILERHNLADQLLHLDLTGSHKLDGETVVAAAVPEAALGRDLLQTQGHDGEGDVVAAHAALDVSAAVAHGVQARLDAGLGTARVDDDVGAAGEARRELPDVGRVLLGGHALADVGVGRVERGGEVQLGLDDVDRHDRRGAEGARHGGAEQAHGPGAHDDDGLAGRDAGLAHDVHGDGEGLDQRALLERHGVGQLVAEVGGRGPEAGQGAVVGGRGGEAHLGAQVVVAAEAGGAAAAGVAGLEGDAVAGLEGRHGGAGAHDGAGGLVAEDHGGAHDEVADAALLPVVHVGPADARVVHGHEDFVLALEGRDRAVDEGDIVGLVEDEGEVLLGVIWWLEGIVSDGVGRDAGWYTRWLSRDPLLLWCDV